MLIVISNPTFIKNEASLVNQLFDEGLEVFHLRKPESSKNELLFLLQEINSKHYSKIALHGHHDVAQKFGITRLHYTEGIRKQLNFEQLSGSENIYSTSVHALDEYKNLSAHFSYTFISPLFDSISKPGYQAQSFDLSSINKKKETKLIALGGINVVNYSKAYEMGFDGIALLGAIWNSEDVIKTFKTIQTQCPIIAQ